MREIFYHRRDNKEDDFRFIRTVDGKTPTTEQELKIASLNPMVRAYVNMDILIDRETTSEGKRAKLRDHQIGLLAHMGDLELTQLAGFRAWQIRYYYEEARGGGSDDAA